MKIIFRYIFKETLWPFVFGFLFFNFILFVGIVFDLTRLLFVENAPFFHVLQLIIFSLPSFFDIVIPVALLFSILLNFGRLSADGEITALRSSGISLFRVQTPVLFFAIILTIISLFFSAFLTPWSNQMYKRTYQQILMQRPEVQLKEKTIITIDDKKLYTFELNEKKDLMQGIVLCEFSSPGDQKFPQVSVAEKGKIIEEKIVLEDIELYIFGNNYRLSQYGKLDQQIIYLYPEAEGRGEAKKESWDMTLAELKEKLDEEKLSPEQRRKLKTDFHGRISIPLATIILGIFAVPLGIRMQRGDRSISLGVSLVVVVAYYILFLAGNFLSRAQMLPPFVGVWIPNFVLLFFGLWLNIQMMRK